MAISERQQLVKRAGFQTFGFTKTSSSLALKLSPGIATTADEIILGFEDAIGEPVFVHEAPVV